MLDKYHKIQEQWNDSSEEVELWLEGRQNLIVEYCGLAALRSHSQKFQFDELPSKEEIQHFSQHLVDYISVGHFKIYNMFYQHWRLRRFVATPEIKEAYSHAILTTEPLLNFADKYATVEENDIFAEFDHDLSLIGEILEVRLELEDLLCGLIADTLISKR